MKLKLFLLTPIGGFVHPPCVDASFDWLVLHPPLDPKAVLGLVALHRPCLIVSRGARDPWGFFEILPPDVRRLWRHFDDPFRQLSADELVDMFLETTQPPQQPQHPPQPLVSVVTRTCKGCIKQMELPFQSLLGQTYGHWEWIVWDDSPSSDDAGQALAQADPRVRVVRSRPSHDGGAFRIARGQWILELDDDAALVDTWLEWLVDVHQRYPDAAFVYGDGYSESFQPPPDEFSSLGYGSHVKRFSHKHYHWTAQAPPINPVTLSHAAALPLRACAWRADVFAHVDKLRASFLALPKAAADYELLLLTFLHTNPGSWVRIAAPAWRPKKPSEPPSEHHHFSDAFGRLGHQVVPRIHARYWPQLQEKYLRLGWGMLVSYPDRPVWHYDPRRRPSHRPFQTIYVPEDRDRHLPCATVLLYCGGGGGRSSSAQQVKDSMYSVMWQSHVNWVLYVLGPAALLDPILADFADPRIRHAPVEPARARAFAALMVPKTRFVLSMQAGEVWSTGHVMDFINAQSTQ